MDPETRERLIEIIGNFKQEVWEEYEEFIYGTQKEGWKEILEQKREKEIYEIQEIIDTLAFKK